MRVNVVKWWTSRTHKAATTLQINSFIMIWNKKPLPSSNGSRKNTRSGLFKIWKWMTSTHVAIESVHWIRMSIDLGCNDWKYLAVSESLLTNFLRNNIHTLHTNSSECTSFKESINGGSLIPPQMNCCKFVKLSIILEKYFLFNSVNVFNGIATEAR